MTNAAIKQQLDYFIKLVIVGDSGVGKTNLLSRFQKNSFLIDSKATIGVQFVTKTVEIDGCKIKIQAWDTAGQQRFRATTQSYYKGAFGAFLVFDITRRSSYDNLSGWLKQLKQNTCDNIVCILIGNKSDLSYNRCVKQEQVAQFAQENKLFYLETSALNASNVDKAFMTVIKCKGGQIYDIRKKNKTAPSNSNHNNTKMKPVTLQKHQEENNGQKKKKKEKQCC